MADPLALAALALFGLLGGVAGGLFGIGGGVIVVPAMVLLLGVEFHAAKAASLLVIMLVTALGILEHRRGRHVDLLLGGLLAAGGVSGSVLSVHLAESLDAAFLRQLFGLVLVATGVRLWFEVRPRPVRGVVLAPLAPLLGFGAGLLAGLFGIGGGILMVPAMVALGVPIHTAVGTSLVAVLANSAAGTVAHFQLGYAGAMGTYGVPLAAGSAMGIVAGARAASRLQARRLRRAFGVFLVLVGLFMALTSP